MRPFIIWPLAKFNLRIHISNILSIRWNSEKNNSPSLTVATCVLFIRYDRFIAISSQDFRKKSLISVLKQHSHINNLRTPNHYKLMFHNHNHNTQSKAVAAATVIAMSPHGCNHNLSYCLSQSASAAFSERAGRAPLFIFLTAVVQSVSTTSAV